MNIAEKKTHHAEQINFGNIFKEQINKLNEYQKNSEKAISQFLTGEVQDLHQVVITGEEAKLSMHLAVQVRNKLVEAYQEMMRMQL